MTEPTYVPREICEIKSKNLEDALKEIQLTTKATKDSVDNLTLAVGQIQQWKANGEANKKQSNTKAIRWIALTGVIVGAASNLDKFIALLAR